MGAAAHSRLPGVALRDFTRSWRSGLAWGALIAHFAPDALDFSTLDQRAATENDPEACRANLTKVFEVAKKLGIPALLDVDDMVKTPEKHWVTTYTICFYNRFGEDGKPRHETSTRATAPSKPADAAEAPELSQPHPAERRLLMRTPSAESFLVNFGSDSHSPSVSPTVTSRTIGTRIGASSSRCRTAVNEPARPHGGPFDRTATNTLGSDRPLELRRSESDTNSAVGDKKDKNKEKKERKHEHHKSTMSQNNTIRTQGAPIMKELVSQKETETIRELARRLLEGDGVDKDEAKAVSLLEGCVARCDSNAMVMLAKCCTLGCGIKRNAERAEALVSDAAEKGNDEARILLQLINDWKGKEFISLWSL